MKQIALFLGANRAIIAVLGISLRLFMAHLSFDERMHALQTQA